MYETIFTIGHSTLSINRLVELLQMHDISAVSDVRSRPYSRFNPQFNRETLKDALRKANIKYVFLGEELGARSEDESCYCDGRVQYDLLARTQLFRNGIERVKIGARSYRVALLCAEKDPLHCHRSILIARYLLDQGFQVKHILSDGKLEEHDDMMARLVELLHIRTSDMFKDKEEVIQEAYTKQGNNIAYEKEPNENSDSENADEGSGTAAR